MKITTDNSNGHNDTDGHEMVYPQSWSIVLRNNETRQLVLYDKESHTVTVKSLQLVPREQQMHRQSFFDSTAEDTSGNGMEPGPTHCAVDGRSSDVSTCPLCRQPLQHNISNTQRPPGSGSQTQYTDPSSSDKSFIDADYFWMLSRLDRPAIEPPTRVMARQSIQPIPRLAKPNLSISNTPAFTADDIPFSSSAFPASPISGLDNTESINGIGMQRQKSSHLNSDSFNQGYYDRFFVEEKKLGRGQRGSVFLCQHVLDKVPLGQFAVKAIPVGTSHTWLVRMLKEVHLLERLKHINIIEYKHAWLEYRQLTLFGPSIPCLFILMELANGGSLEEYLHIQWDPMSCDDKSKENETNHKQKMSFKAKVAARRFRRSIGSSPPGRSESLASAMSSSNLDWNDTEHNESTHTWPPQSLSDLASQQIGQTRDTSDDASTFIHGGIGVGLDGKKVRYLTEKVIRSLFLDICHGLEHLHRHGIIHRDLKPPNLLLRYADEHRNGIPRVLISDFGECEVISDAMERERTGATGTLEFMPPELLHKDVCGQYLPNHSLKADIWSLGVVLYYLCYSSVPYVQVDDVDQLKEDIINFKSVRFPESGNRVPEDLKQLICRLMKTDPDARPTVDDILRRYEQENMPAEDETQSGRRNSIMPRLSAHHGDLQCDAVNESQNLVNVPDITKVAEVTEVTKLLQTVSEPNHAAIPPVGLNDITRVNPSLQSPTTIHVGLWIIAKVGTASLICFPESVRMVALNTIIASMLLDLYIIGNPKFMRWIAIQIMAAMIGYAYLTGYGYGGICI
ncbi:putative serine/threonine-protein kinase iks1 [Batrachochytrium dendrobatidis]|nr:putative serine/threonine-protein kinase iks1 [Batrachochytrium dendrobatidis]